MALAYQTENFASSISSGNDFRLCSKRKRSVDVSKRQDDIAWTAARCNRLLRTIASRINILRKLAEVHVPEKNTTRSRSRSKTPAPSRSQSNTDDLTKSLSRMKACSATTFDSPSGNDPDWLPQDARPLPNKIYGRRSRRIEQPQEPASHKAGFRSPFIRRILRPEPSTSPLLKFGSKCNTPGYRNGTRERKRRSLHLLPANAADKAFKTLIQAFDTVLLSTKDVQPLTRTGPASLMDMCLRKVPAYIELEQDFAEDEEECYDLSEVVAEVYEYLETIGSRDGGGWLGLRHVVRAHAVELMIKAMRDKLFHVDPLETLLEICDQRDALAETHGILRAWVLTTEQPMPSKLDTLTRCCVERNSEEFLFRTLAELLDDGLLDEVDFCDESLIWRTLLKAMTISSMRRDAVSFFESYVLACIENGCDPNSDNQLESAWSRDSRQNIVVLLTAIGWTNDFVKENGKDVSDLLGRLAHRLAMTCYEVSNGIKTHDTKYEEAAIATRMRMTEPFLMSNLLLFIMSRHPPSKNEITQFKLVSNMLEEQESVLAAHNGPREIATDRAVFVRDVARCIAHADVSAAEHFVKDFAARLYQVANANRKAAPSVLKRIAIDSALAWAEYRDDDDSYDLAKDLENSTLTDMDEDELDLTPISSRKRREYHWDEGICEWIADSPLMSRNGEKHPLLPDETDFSNQIKADSLSLAARDADPDEDMPSVELSSSDDSPDEDQDELGTTTPQVRRQIHPRSMGRCESASFPDERDTVECEQIRRKVRITRSVSSSDDSSEDELGF